MAPSTTSSWFSLDGIMNDVTTAVRSFNPPATKSKRSRARLAASGGRDVTRDVVRGLTSLEMTFVNSSGLKWTNHSRYIGQVTYADTVFPCFAFLAGMSPISGYRALKLSRLGLGMNLLSTFINNKDYIRGPSVLQRLGLAGWIASTPYLSPLQQLYGLPLIAVWYVVAIAAADRKKLPSNPLANPKFRTRSSGDASSTAQTRIDTAVYGRKRLYRRDYDPEGLLGALTTAVTMLLGRWFNESSDLTAYQKAGVAVGMISTGEALHFALPRYAPISKSLWTPSFTLVTAGTSILKYLAVAKVVPYLPAVVLAPLRATGRRSLEAYLFSYLLSIVLTFGDDHSLWEGGIYYLKKVVPEPVADFILSISSSAAVAAFAQYLVAENLKLKW